MDAAEIGATPLARIPEDVFGDERRLWSIAARPDGAWDLHERRLDVRLPIRPGFLAGLLQVSDEAQARDFARRNSAQLVPERGLVLRSAACAELLVFVDDPSEVPCSDSAFDVDLLVHTGPSDGLHATLGPPSFLFERLIWRPAQSRDASLPDSGVIRTLALHGCPSDRVASTTELALLSLREARPTLRLRAPGLQPPRDTVPSPHAAITLRDPRWARSVALYNRAVEEPAIAGFLLFYRVIESCFEEVAHDDLARLRHDPALPDLEFARRALDLFRASRDVERLTTVLRRMAYGPWLDEAASQGGIAEPSLDALARAIDQRRNAIAHARWSEGSLIAYAFEPGHDPGSDERWWSLAQRIARAALDAWALEP